jgi:hypothetical protein
MIMGFDCEDGPDESFSGVRSMIIFGLEDVPVRALLGVTGSFRAGEVS